MSLEKDLKDRSGNVCELCAATENLQQHEVTPKSNGYLDESIYACSTCIEQIENTDKMDANHWRCLNDSMWSEVNAVKVIAWRMLSRLKSEGWPVDLLEMMYLEEEVQTWAESTGEGIEEGDKVIHRDSVGAILSSGDSVVVIKDLKVKGSSLVAKQGTAVRNIILDQNNAEHIEGKVLGQHIVILTQYVKKSS